MDGTQPDGEVTEFRPWSYPDSPPERDWRAWAAAGAALLILGGGGLYWRASLTDRMTTDPTPIVATPSVPTTVPLSPVTTGGPEGSRAADPPALLSEADLRATGSGPTDLAIMAVAEEAVMAHFTSASSGDDEVPGYVEWARAIDFRADEGGSTIAVRFSVVALSDTPWRLPVRTVEVEVQRDEGTWTVQGLPRLVDDAPELRWETPELSEVPAEVRARFEEAGWTIRGGVEQTDGWDVVVADATGAAMVVFIASLDGGG